MSEGLHESRATRVVLFEDRAEVHRVAELTLPVGRRTVAIGGLSVLVDDRSLSVEAKGASGDVLVAGARIVRRRATDEEARRQRVAELRAELRPVEVAMAELDARIGRALGAVEKLEAGLERFDAAFAKALPGEDALAEWRAAHVHLFAELERRMAEVEAARIERIGVGETRARLEAALAAAAVESPALEASAELDLDVGAPTSATIELTYRVPCAAWRPEHLARLDGVGAEAKLELVTYATAWQITGERWVGVLAEFSTARPRGVPPVPTLADDVIVSRKKTAEERAVVRVEAHEEAVLSTGVVGATRRKDELPGVDDGGEPRVFASGAPIDLPSTGAPVSFEVARVTLGARVSRVARPEVDPRAHFRAALSLTGGGPILAGPVRLARGAAWVGRARIGFVAPGEGFELGFGPDDGLRVRRGVSERREQVMIIGTQKIERTISLSLSNLSNERRPLVLHERVPVSELPEITIGLKDAGPFAPPDPDGFLLANLELAPRETRVVHFRYEIQAGANVRLPF